MISPALRLLIVGFMKIPKGVLIDRPDELVETDFVVNQEMVHVICQNSFEPRVFFTRRTLKHLSEKGRIVLTIIELIEDVLKYPEFIYKGTGSRCLIVEKLPRDARGRFIVAIIECERCKFLIIITAFFTDEKYLKNFEILWRTAAS